MIRASGKIEETHNSIDFSEEESLASEQPSGSILQKEQGKFFWVYEMPMLKSFFLLFEVWRALGAAFLTVAALMVIINLVSGNGTGSLWEVLMPPLIPFAIIMVLSVPAYYIVTKANNGRYTVLFEMDDEGIDHIQIKTEKARALDLLTVFVGKAAGNRTATAAGMLSASGGSLYSRFSSVRKIRAYPGKHLITLTGRLVRNQVYADDEDFDFVYDYIVSRCPGADAGYIGKR
ncbi:MAG: hypothetical protein K6D03_12360 [Solobacterium sp.]|nr:hypothetical protein [Solobacterium sp.]